ncbi:MAG: hypothetical protein M9955_13350 [Rhizobiaceae bacterium]|nr:hypothetical protein [Rhizobiaceae bacterium]
MTSILSLAAVRKEREPDAECVHELEDGRKMFLFSAVYQHGEEEEDIYIWAFDLLDAERRVLSMARTLVIVGQLSRMPE